MRWADHRSFVLFGFVGAFGTACQFVVLFVLARYAGVDVVKASTAGAVVGAVVNFLLNHNFTFLDTPSAFRTAPRFLVLVAISLLTNGLLVYLFAQVLHWNYLFAQVVATSIVFLVNYGLSSLWVFKSIEP